jgi:transcriptional regulator with PAS, ATPase and Fis domain
LARDKECEKCVTRKALESKQLEEIEKYIPQLDSYYSCRSQPILDDKGNVVYIVEHLRDITARKKEEIKLQKEKDFMFEIFDSMEQYVFVDSSDHKIEFMNNKAKEEFGDLVGEKCYKKLEKNSPCTVCPIPEALHEIKRCAGSQFDPHLAEKFISIFE